MPPVPPPPPPPLDPPLLGSITLNIEVIDKINIGGLYEHKRDGLGKRLREHSLPESVDIILYSLVTTPVGTCKLKVCVAKYIYYNPVDHPDQVVT